MSAGDSATAKRLFAKPTRDYATAPLWVWNDQLTEDQVVGTMRDLAAQQVKQVFVHPRPGLMTPYLSPDWFRLWKAALREAERLDMNVWIYDENSYPSGFAGGFVPDAMPESRGRGLAMKEAKSPPKWADSFLAVYRFANNEWINVSAKVKANEALPEDRYLIASMVRASNSPWHGGKCYVDLLYPGVTEKFLDITLEAYRREIGNQFGKRVPGSFTDEPNIHPAGGLPWTEDLPQQFQKRWGYNLLDCLPSLTQPIGDWRKIRHNYYQTLSELFIERWAKPYHDYCEKNGLQFTGHYWDHEWPNCTGVPDNMAMYAWHQRPAIDCLMNQYQENTHAQFGNARMPKELSSVANQLGYSRTLCEIYGAGGWDLRFEDMKRIGDWLEVLGVNTLDEHLSYVTIRGARKRDHPQSFSYHEPWWQGYHVSASYLTRVSVALSQGQQINRILVLEPTSTAWMYQGDNALLKAIGDSFFNQLMALENNQIEYDLGCEDIIARHGSVAGKELRVGKRAYPVVVLPSGTENLNQPTLKLLEQLLQAGGKVILCGETPTRIDGGAASNNTPLLSNPNHQIVPPGELPQMLRQCTNPEAFELARTPGDQGILFHHRRQLDDGELLFLVNTSLESASSGTVSTRRQSMEQWDLYTGKVAPYPFTVQSGKGVTASFKLPPSGSLLLFLSNRKQAPAPVIVRTTSTINAQAEPEIRRRAPNVLTLDYVDVTAGGETKQNLYFYQANQFVWQKNGMPRNPWDSAVQFRDEFITKQFPADSGFTASYQFKIQGSVPRNLAIVIERPDLYTIQCNGQTVSAAKGDWWLDRAFGRIDLSAVAQVGDNVVSIKASPFTIYHELESAYLLGEFSLSPSDKGFVVAPDRNLKLGKWNEQGHPFYSAGVEYRERFAIAQPKGTYAVSLPGWYGSLAEVRVNGKPTGYITAPPWECDVTSAIKKGENTIEVAAIGTLKNTLGPHHGKPGLGSAWPGMFQQGPNPGPPPGVDYSTVGYGLFAPFVLKQTSP